jgi:C1A family cysteine protease
MPTEGRANSLAAAACVLLMVHIFCVSAIDHTSPEYIRTIPQFFPRGREKLETRFPTLSAAAAAAPLPDSYDVRDHYKVTPVLDQGTCGSCW